MSAFDVQSERIVISTMHRGVVLEFAFAPILNGSAAHLKLLAGITAAVQAAAANASLEDEQGLPENFTAEAPASNEGRALDNMRFVLASQIREVRKAGETWEPCAFCVAMEEERPGVFSLLRFPRFDTDAFSALTRDLQTETLSVLEHLRQSRVQATTTAVK